MDYKPDPMPDTGSQQPQHLRTPGAGKLNKKTLLIISVAVAIVVLGAVLALFLLKDKRTPTNTAQTTQQQSTQTEEELPEPTADDATPQQYKNTVLNIELTHRKDWTVKESADKKQVTITSPKTSYQTAEGDSKKGVFTLKIGFGASTGAQTAINNAKAVKDSFLIAYDAPTEAQRHYTNISYVGDTNFTFFIVTGSNAYKPGDPVAQKISDADFLIAGGYGADDQDNLGFEAMDPADIEQTPYEQAVAIVKSLKVY